MPHGPRSRRSLTDRIRPCRLTRLRKTPDPRRRQLSGKAYLRLVLLGAAIGIPAALVAVGFLAAVHQLEHVLWHDLPDALGQDSPPWYLIVGLPAVGAGFVVAARRLLPGDGGHNPIEGLSLSPTPLAYGPASRWRPWGPSPSARCSGRRRR